MGAPVAPADFAGFYRGELPRVFRAAYLLTGDRQLAMDVAQEAFERAFARWRRLSGEAWSGGWVMTTALNLARRRLRGRREVVGPDPDTTASGPDESRVDLVRALAALPFRQRQALVLHYVGDLDTAAVAEVMRVSEGTVKAHLAQGRAALRRKLEVRS